MAETTFTELDKLRNEFPEVTATVEKVVRENYEERFEIWKSTEFADYEKEQTEQLKEIAAEYFKKLEQEQKPLTQEEIQALLEQDYGSFTIAVTDSETGENKSFVVQELPSAQERIFYKKFKDQLTGKSSQIAALAQETMDLPMDKKIESFLEAFDGFFDLLADAVVLILNPRGKKEFVTQKWVMDNMSSHRQWNIVKAQIEVNKLRDFFSELFQNGMKTQSLTMPANVQTLRQQLRK